MEGRVDELLLRLGPAHCSCLTFSEWNRRKDEDFIGKVLAQSVRSIEKRLGYHFMQGNGGKISCSHGRTHSF